MEVLCYQASRSSRQRIFRNAYRRSECRTGTAPVIEAKREDEFRRGESIRMAQLEDSAEVAATNVDLQYDVQA